MINMGDKAPDFSLVNTDFKSVRLSDFQGKKRVLLFYPGAFTSVCQKELCAFRDSISMFGKLNAIVLGISVDSPFANKSFKEQNMITFELLSDITREISNTYCGLYNDFAGVEGYNVARRSVFVIDSREVVTYSWVSEDPAREPEYNKVLEEVKKA